MPKITPFLWFNLNAEAAMQTYSAHFKNSKINSIFRYPDGPLEGPMAGLEGKVLTGQITLAGQALMTLDGGPSFKFTPAASFFVECQSVEEIDSLWAALSAGGNVMMPLGEYPFSERFGWCADQYGLSWQLALGARPQNISAFLMFSDQQYGKGEEAIRFYMSLFKDSQLSSLMHTTPSDNQPPVLQRAAFQMGGQQFIAIDSDYKHGFGFNEAFSLYVECDSQEEIDHFWNALSAHPESEQCGWLKDKYGLSWQIIPAVLSQYMESTDAQKSKRVMDAVMSMKKMDIAALKSVYEG
jgi:predicted 3-demethylubiquinone-9 3-methyltransferase (glyoxalase superfamily)